MSQRGSVVTEIKPGSFTCKATAQHAVLSFEPWLLYILNFYEIPTLFLIILKEFFYFLNFLYDLMGIPYLSMILKHLLQQGLF